MGGSRKQCHLALREDPAGSVGDLGGVMGAAALREQRSVCTGRYTVRGSHLEYVDDTGFIATGDIRDGVLCREHLALYREPQPQV
ncbi:Atu4866 domain-containing protein [Streptomyces sp. NPDC059785]|uniref:Atu4866 domain-containing protein n=1 Tax=unclassified Streptomyces TaxID=2593676 RepID=UPI00364696E2